MRQSETMDMVGAGGGKAVGSRLDTTVADLRRVVALVVAEERPPPPPAARGRRMDPWQEAEELGAAKSGMVEGHPS